MRKQVETNPVNTGQEKNYWRRAGCKKREGSNLEKENIQIMKIKIKNTPAIRKSKNMSQWQKIMFAKKSCSKCSREQIKTGD